MRSIFQGMIDRIIEKKFHKNARDAAPKDKLENEHLDKVKSLLVDAFRTTRKFGLGWMFISRARFNTLSSQLVSIIEKTITK